MSPRPTPRSSTSPLVVLPVVGIALLMVARWRAGVAFLEPVYGVPAAAFYLACAACSAGTTVAMVGRREANAAVAGIGFACGGLGALAFDAWAGWRGLLWGGEVFAFVIALLVAPLWLSYAVRTVPEGAREERARDEEPW